MPGYRSGDVVRNRRKSKTQDRVVLLRMRMAAGEVATNAPTMMSVVAGWTARNVLSRNLKPANEGATRRDICDCVMSLCAEAFL